MCGILGLLSHDPSVEVAQEICDGLSLLQHRGQDACGIVTCGPKGRFYQCKANGMVRDVFDTNALSRLFGGMGIGHGEQRALWLLGRTADPVASSALPHCGKLSPCGGAAVLRQFPVRNRVCPCQSNLPCAHVAQLIPAVV